MSILTWLILDFGFDLSYYKREKSDKKFAIEPFITSAGFTIYIYSVSISIYSPFYRSAERREKLMKKYYGDLHVKF